MTRDWSMVGVVPKGFGDSQMTVFATRHVLAVGGNLYSTRCLGHRLRLADDASQWQVPNVLLFPSHVLASFTRGGDEAIL